MVPMDRTYVRCGLTIAALVLIVVALGAAHIWRNVSDPTGELYNYHEWSLVQAMQQQAQGEPFSDSVRTFPMVLKYEDYDAIALPRLDKKGSVWILSNASGIPRIKRGPSDVPRSICQSELEHVRSTVRLNADVKTFLEALTRVDCVR